MRHLFSTWASAADTAGLDVMVDMLHIVTAAQELAAILIQPRDMGSATKSTTPHVLRHVEALASALAAAQAAAARSRNAHEWLSQSVTELLSKNREGAAKMLPSSLTQARDDAFEAFRAALVQLEREVEHAAAASISATADSDRLSLMSALRHLGDTVKLPLHDTMGVCAEMETGDLVNADVHAVADIERFLATEADNFAQHVQAAIAAWPPAPVAKDDGPCEDGACAAEPHCARLADLAKENAAANTKATAPSSSGGDRASLLQTFGDILRLGLGSLQRITRKMPWGALLRTAARTMQDLEEAQERVERCASRAQLLRGEFAAFDRGLTKEKRERIEQFLKARRIAKQNEKDCLVMSHRRKVKAINASLDNGEDSDSFDDDDLEAEAKLAAAHEAKVQSTKAYEQAARALFLAAKAYHPETLWTYRTQLRSYAHCTVWSERTFDDYDALDLPSREDKKPYAMLTAMYGGHRCVLKRAPLTDGQLLFREAEVLGRLSHPNIVKLETMFVDTRVDIPSLYLHFCCAEHDTLARYLELQSSKELSLPGVQPVTAAQLTHLARQLCEAVAYLAECNVVHCDITPANVLIDNTQVPSKDGGFLPVAVLGHFGASRTAIGRTTATLSRTGAETLDQTAPSSGGRFAAPEMVCASEGRPLRATSKLDVYSLGCVIYHMHYFPRALPMPKSPTFEVAGCDALFELVARGQQLPHCAVPSWSQAAPRGALQDAVRQATRADASARLSPREMLQTPYLRDAGGSFAPGPLHCPSHWEHQQCPGSWLVTEGAEVAAQVETLLNKSAIPLHNGTRWGQRFRRFKVVRVKRVENSQIWPVYAARRRAMADELAAEGYTLPAEARQLSTAGFMYPMEGGTLERAAGEVFLLHGTRSVDSITASGFDLRYAFDTARGGTALFGRGVYFAESATKADQYVGRQSDGGTLSLIIARVCLGRCQVVRQCRQRQTFLPHVEAKSTPSAPVYYDSILTTVSGLPFREVVVGKDTSAYPELVVEYERVMDEA